VRALLGGAVELAVLAQPHRRFRRWSTVEVRGEERWYEGWREESGEREPLAQTADEDFDPVVTEAVRIAAIDPALLELGLDGKGLWVLQIRPAPTRARPQPSVPEQEGSLRFPGLGPVVHPGDAKLEFTADLEHCPTPLSVLLATTFGRWIAEDPAHTSSRIVEGRWHDPVGIGETAADAEEAESVHLAGKRELSSRLEPALAHLRRSSEELDGSSGTWARFQDDWLEVQRIYFHLPGAKARRWARARLAAAEHRPSLADTPTAERSRRWASLGERVRGHPDGPFPTVESLARWVATHPTDPLAEALESTAIEDRAVSPTPYDGFSPGLDEDPWPLYRALLASPRPRREHEVDDPVDPELRLATAILAWAETDNEFLLESYARWRSAVRRLAEIRELGSALPLHRLDARTLDGWLAQGGEFPAAAARRGASIHFAWSAAPATSEAGENADLLSGTAASPGRAQGTVARGASLLELPPAEIAVVSTMTPQDGLAVGRFAGVVCEAGDVLGHASILCREQGVPCVVGVRNARRRLRRARRVLVDGDFGLVRVLD
jgi:phosphohistidine swiveling domain-containing protein